MCSLETHWIFKMCHSWLIHPLFNTIYINPHLPLHRLFNYFSWCLTPLIPRTYTCNRTAYMLVFTMTWQHWIWTDPTATNAIEWMASIHWGAVGSISTYSSIVDELKRSQTLYLLFPKSITVKCNDLPLHANSPSMQ